MPSAQSMGEIGAGTTRPRRAPQCPAAGPARARHALHVVRSPPGPAQQPAETRGLRPAVQPHQRTAIPIQAERASAWLDDGIRLATAVDTFPIRASDDLDRPKSRRPEAGTAARSRPDDSTSRRGAVDPAGSTTAPTWAGRVGAGTAAGISGTRKSGGVTSLIKNSTQSPCARAGLRPIAPATIAARATPRATIVLLRQIWKTVSTGRTSLYENQWTDGADLSWSGPELCPTDLENLSISDLASPAACPDLARPWAGPSPRPARVARRDHPGSSPRSEPGALKARSVSRHKAPRRRPATGC